MAYKVIILYRLYMPSYFLGTFTEYPYVKVSKGTVRGYLRELGYTFATRSGTIGRNMVQFVRKHSRIPVTSHAAS